MKIDIQCERDGRKMWFSLQTTHSDAHVFLTEHKALQNVIRTIVQEAVLKYYDEVTK